MHRAPSMFLVLLLLAGCQSTLTGNEGNLQFWYEADDRVTDFNKPVAVGAFLDVHVREAGNLMAVTVTAAAFDDPAVLDVEAFSGDTITIAGVGDGTALLEVEAETSGGEVLPDSVNMLAAVPEVLVLGHTCTAGVTAGYLTDQRAWVPFEMEKENGQPVIGYGYYPLTVDGTAATLASGDSNQQWMAFDMGAAAGTVTLQSDLDDETLTMEVVAPTAIDGVEQPTAFVAEDIDVGDVNAFYVRPTTGGLVICQAETAMTVASLTPTICDARTAEPPAGASEHENGWFAIEGLAEGTCEYTVTFTEGADGAGASATFSYPIEP